MQIKLQLKVLSSPILHIIVVVLVRNKPHFKYFRIHTFHYLRDYGKERILMSDRGHCNSVALHSMEGEAAHRSG